MKFLHLGLNIVKGASRLFAGLHLLFPLYSRLFRQKRRKKAKELRRVKKRGGERGSCSVGRSVG